MQTYLVFLFLLSSVVLHNIILLLRWFLRLERVYFCFDEEYKTSQEARKYKYKSSYSHNTIPHRRINKSVMKRHKQGQHAGFLCVSLFKLGHKNGKGIVENRHKNVLCWLFLSIRGNSYKAFSTKVLEKHGTFVQCKLSKYTRHEAP